MSENPTFEDFMDEWTSTPDGLNYVIAASHDKSDKSFYVHIAQPRKDRITSEIIYYKTKSGKETILKWLEKNKKFINENFISEI